MCSPSYSYDDAFAKTHNIRIENRDNIQREIEEELNFRTPFTLKIRDIFRSYQKGSFACAYPRVTEELSQLIVNPTIVEFAKCEDRSQLDKLVPTICKIINTTNLIDIFVFQPVIPCEDQSHALYLMKTGNYSKDQYYRDCVYDKSVRPLHMMNRSSPFHEWSPKLQRDYIHLISSYVLENSSSEDPEIMGANCEIINAIREYSKKNKRPDLSEIVDRAEFYWEENELNEIVKNLKNISQKINNPKLAIIADLINAEKSSKTC